MVEGGPIDVLTGDWLAELTMLHPGQQRRPSGPAAGYARTFVTQMEQVMGTCLDRGIKVVSNAGGLDPAGCAEAVAGGGRPARAAAEHRLRRGRRPRRPRSTSCWPPASTCANLDTGRAARRARGRGPHRQRLPRRAGASSRRCARGADIVVTGRVTDAAVVVRARRVAPPAGRGTTGTAWPARCVAGHVIECGAQATGGNYAFFTEVPGMDAPRLPAGRGAPPTAPRSSPSTPARAGEVSIGTVTSQLLYEIGGPALPQPRRDRPLRHHQPRRTTGPTGSASRAPGASRPRPRSRWP